MDDALFKTEGAELVVWDSEFYSFCECNLLPFFRRVHIAYLWDKIILSLSKFGHIVAMLARCLQVQKRLMTESADAVIETW